MGTPATDVMERSAQAVERWNARIWRMVAVTCMAFLLLMSGVLAFVVTEVSQIRTTQLSNTKVTERSATVGSCQERSFNLLLQDIHLLYNHDKNPADFPKPPIQC